MRFWLHFFLFFDIIEVIHYKGKYYYENEKKKARC